MIHDFILREFNHRSFVTLTASLQVNNSTLDISWVVNGNISLINLSQKANELTKADRLWENTCFEIFLKRRNQKNYFEYNFAPNKSWNCYCFSDYRTGMKPFDIKPPLLDFKTSHKLLAMSVKVDLPAELINKSDLAVGLTAVLNTADGLTYWALKHPEATPDFHCYFENITS